MRSKEHLLANHGYNGNSPVDFEQPANEFGEELIKKMSEHKETLYVVRASTIPHNTFTSDELHEKWEGIIGRLIIVDDSPMAKKSGSTFVYSYLPGITQELRTFHIKDSGTPANPQMNLRRIFENFKDEDLDTLESSIDEQIAWLENEGAINLPAEKIRKKEWLVTKQRQYLSLKKFKEFLTFLKQLKTSDEEERTTIDNELVGEAEKLTMKYFYSSLKGKNYSCTYVPEGGGRRALGHVANYQRDLFKAKLEIYKDTKLPTMRVRLNALKASRGVDQDSTVIADAALARSMYERDGSQLHDISGNPPGISGHIQAKASAALQRGANALSEQLQGARVSVEDLTERNISGEVAARVAEKLGEHGVGGASKIGERKTGRGLARALRGVQGLTHRVADAVLTAGESAIRRVQRLDENHDLDLDFAEAMLNDIENGSFHPSIAKAKIGWTIDDVFLKEDFPSKNYIHMEMKADGEPDPKSLERQLEDVHEKLRDFPELFELYCSSIVLYVNDPHNPTSKALRPQTKIDILQIASKFGLTICSDEAYRKQIDKKLKNAQGDWSLAEFYEEHPTHFAKPVTIHTVLATTKFYGAGKRTGSVVTNESSGGLVRHIKTHTNSVNTMSVKMDVQMLEMGIAVKNVCEKLEKIYLGADPDKTLEAILAKEAPGPLYFALIDARNNLDILKTRSSNMAEYRLEAVNFINKLLSDLKNFRLEKLSQRDSQNRNIAAKKAVEAISKDYPEIKDRCIQPEGPFYMCIKLDETGSDQSLFPFLSAIAEARNIDVVPQADGYVRFAFGGIMDSNPESYDLYSLAIETNLRLLLKYWAEFKERRASQRKDGNSHPETGALEEMFPGGEEELVRAYYDKEQLIAAIGAYEKKHKKGSPLAYTHRSDVDEYISRIEPGSKSHVVTIKEVKCKTAQEFVESKAFRDLYNNYLLEIQSRIPALQSLSQNDLFAKYGAVKIADKFKRKVYKNQERKVFAAIVTEMAKLWFSDSTIKILAKEGGDITQEDLMGTGQKLSGFIQELVKATLTKDQEKALIADINKREKPEFEDVETKYKSTFQAGYSYLKGLTASAKNSPWLSRTITRGEYAKETVATDSSPTVTTGSSARVPGIDRQIFQRDGDGERAPKSEYFSQRLARFAEVYDPEKFLMKMVHVGGTKVLVVMDRSYSHYISDEIRLFPQFEVTEDDLKDIKPDAVSFLGLPTNVMGEDYKLGYFMDKDEDGNEVPVSWVDKEDITDYMGYFKKPILTVANEVVKNKEMLPIHGSAMTICLKNGMRKTVVMGGDSGTGKSETIIAMMEDVVKNAGSQVESIELLAGDMLSLFEGDDGQVYMLGTEQGDFMRMTDISDGWQERFRNLLETGARSNLNDPKNPRITVSGICDANKISVPTRVNMFLNINNYAEPPGGISFHEIDDPENLMLKDYVRGYRGEKGTSGDQPNLFASISATKNISNKKQLLKYGEKMDSLIAWDDIVDDSGKAVNAIMRFKNVEGGIFKAKQIVKDMFVGKKVGDAIITETPFNVQTGQFEVVFQFADGHTEKTLLDREGVFSKIYNPIASTFCGDPFVDPRNVSKKLLRRFGKVMKNAGVITGTLYTQLKRKGMEFEGPIRAANGVTGFIMDDKRINDRFQGQKKKVNQALQDRYGSAIINRGGTGSIPVDIERQNLYLNEDFERRTIRPQDANGNIIPLKTKRYEYDPKAKAKGFECSLVTPEIQRAIEVVCSESEHDTRPYDMSGVKLSAYKDIKAWNSNEELIYQIMICNGSMMLGYEESVIRQHAVEVKKAEKIAERIMAARRKRAKRTKKAA